MCYVFHSQVTADRDLEKLAHSYTVGEETMQQAMLFGPAVTANSQRYDKAIPVPMWVARFGHEIKGSGALHLNSHRKCWQPMGQPVILT